MVITAGVLCDINRIEWLIILLCIAMVIALEMINSALEKLSDLVEPNYNPTIKIVKDVGAAAVLWSVIISIVIGLVIFIPRIITWSH